MTAVEELAYRIQTGNIDPTRGAAILAWRSGDPVMREQLDAILSHPNPKRNFEHWPYEEFLPIVEAFDRLFEGKELGWLTRT